MTLKKLLISIAGLVSIVGAFLPWYKVSLLGYTASSNAFQMGALYIVLAILAMVCGAAVLVLTLVKEKQIKKVIKIKNFSKLLAITGATLIVIAVIAFIAIKGESQGFGNVSWGIWLIGLAGVAVIVLTCLKNVEQLNKVVFGVEEKKSDTSKKESGKDSTKTTGKSSK